MLLWKFIYYLCVPMLPIWMKVRGQLTSSLLPLWWVPGIRLRLGSKYPGLVNHFAGPEGFIHYVCLYLRRLKEGIGPSGYWSSTWLSATMWVVGIIALNLSLKPKNILFLNDLLQAMLSFNYVGCGFDTLVLDFHECPSSSASRT